MATPSRAEVEAAFKRYLQVGAFDRDWNAWADLFHEDAYYYEVQYGTYRGREAIRTWITTHHGRRARHVLPAAEVDHDRRRPRRLLHRQRLPEPAGPSGPPIGFPTFTVLQYRDGLWASEEDYYDVKASVEARQAFRAGGGKATPPLER